MKLKKKKYSSVRCTCNFGHVHDSRLEARHCNILNMTNEYTEIKTQVKFPLKINDKLICNHYMDFTAIDKTGNLIAIETKGFETDLWKIKSKMFQLLYPEYHYLIWRK